MQQVSLFTGGRITDNLGAFIRGNLRWGRAAIWLGQHRYPLREVRSTVGGHTLLWGAHRQQQPDRPGCLEHRSPPGASPTSASALAPSADRRAHSSTRSTRSRSPVVSDLRLPRRHPSISNSAATGPCRRTPERALGVDTSGPEPDQRHRHHIGASQAEPNIGNHSRRGRHLWPGRGGSSRCGCPGAGIGFLSPTSASTPNINISRRPAHGDAPGQRGSTRTTIPSASQNARARRQFQ